MPLSQSLNATIHPAARRELYLFALYRVLVAAVVSALVFSPLTLLVGEPHHRPLATAVSVSYLLLALLLLWCSRNARRATPLLLGSLTIDICAAVLAMHALPNAGTGIAMMQLFNIAAAATLLPLRYGMSIAAASSAGILLEYLWSTLNGDTAGSTLAELLMFAASYLMLAYISQRISQHARRNQLLADRRGAQVANLAEINELIIRRMRTGVLVVDARNQITLANETAIALIGNSDNSGVANLALAPQLLLRLKRWRSDHEQEQAPLQLAPDRPEIQPRFARLLADSELTLIFLDNASVVSRRAESITLSAMGRFSASLAHEIRNPLAAINYAAQLLEESPAITSSRDDQRLLHIIQTQCQRANGIVESVLSLARRELANPEHIDPAAFVQRFACEYEQTMSIENDQLDTVVGAATAPAMVDPRHLHQILTILVHNAFKYGRQAKPAVRVQLQVTALEHSAVIKVIDDGPGIAEHVLPQLFRPFFTTSEHGTGLGLYIAQELCRANQARLEYRPAPSGGACFQLNLIRAHGLLPKRA